MNLYKRRLDARDGSTYYALLFQVIWSDEESTPKLCHMGRIAQLIERLFCRPIDKMIHLTFNCSMPIDIGSFFRRGKTMGYALYTR